MQSKPEFFYRIQKNKSAFAAKIGISQGYYSQIMRGKKQGAVGTLNKICKRSKGFLKITDFIR